LGNGSLCSPPGTFSLCAPLTNAIANYERLQEELHMKVLDPETATLEEVALAGRNLERAKQMRRAFDEIYADCKAGKE
jgi:hypothetical protein